MKLKSPMKCEEKLELYKEHLRRRGDFRINYDGDDFGIYRFNPKEEKYIGLEVPFGLSLEAMLVIITTKNYFIKAEIA